MIKLTDLPFSTTIEYSLWDVEARIPAKRSLHAVIDTMVSTYKRRPIHLHYIFTNDKNILAINKKHLLHDYYTDIITFDLSESKKLIQSEIYISIETVKSNAKLFKVPFKQELTRVMLHGVLHLCGFKDKSNAQQTTMREMEEFWLKEFDIRINETRTFKPTKHKK